MSSGGHEAEKECSEKKKIAMLVRIPNFMHLNRFSSFYYKVHIFLFLGRRVFSVSHTGGR
ncbi:hypothetical protein VL14_12055 [Cytobacillus firmus]|nr:hypothetical protein VL14_12055 [Cytobacillus firmus]